MCYLAAINLWCLVLSHTRRDLLGRVSCKRVIEYVRKMIRLELLVRLFSEYACISAIPRLLNLSCLQTERLCEYSKSRRYLTVEVRSVFLSESQRGLFDHDCKKIDVDM